MLLNAGCRHCESGQGPDLSRSKLTKAKERPHCSYGNRNPKSAGIYKLAQSEARLVQDRQGDSMATCSRCGQPVEFRYIDGRCIPLHLNGGCGWGGGASNVRDFAGYLRSEESACFRTNCPECGESVYFIRHNGGSIWIDPPLGPPWYKHPCMDQPSHRAKGARSMLVSKSSLSGYSHVDGLIVGVVKEAETTFEGCFTLVNVETGSAENFYLAVKNKAGFLVGKLVVFDPDGKTIKWLEDQTYSFAVLTPVRVPKSYRAWMENFIDCPDCHTRLKAKNLRKHLDSIHGYIVL